MGDPAEDPAGLRAEVMDGRHEHEEDGTRRMPGMSHR